MNKSSVKRVTPAESLMLDCFRQAGLIPLVVMASLVESLEAGINRAEPGPETNTAIKVMYILKSGIEGL